MLHFFNAPLDYDKEKLEQVSKKPRVIKTSKYKYWDILYYCLLDVCWKWCTPTKLNQDLHSTRKWLVFSLFLSFALLAWYRYSRAGQWSTLTGVDTGVPPWDDFLNVYFTSKSYSFPKFFILLSLTSVSKFTCRKDYYIIKEIQEFLSLVYFLLL